MSERCRPLAAATAGNPEFRCRISERENGILRTGTVTYDPLTPSEPAASGNDLQEPLCPPSLGEPVAGGRQEKGHCIEAAPTGSRN